MKQHCTMGSWLLLSVTLLVAVLPGLLASSLHAASLPQRGMFKVAVKDTKCKGQLTSCDGCSKIRNCVQFGSGFYNAGSETNCSGATPYCVEKDKAASCVAMVPASSNCNKPQTANYTCTQVGYFPDVSDCTKYFVCLMDSATKESSPS